ncbi:MAG: MFS transporter [Acidimicrobiales bacterium]
MSVSDTFFAGCGSVGPGYPDREVELGTESTEPAAGTLRHRELRDRALRSNQDPQTFRRRVAILAICSMSLFIVGLDNTIVNVALPSIGAHLHASVSGLQWTVDAYTLVLASLLMLSGSTADRLGRKRTFQTGLIIFSAGSLLCSVAPSLGLLVAFRAFQAIGGSMLNPVALSIITNTFTDRKERAQAIGIWGAVIGLSMGLGPVVGGVLVSAAGWPSIFWVNVPIGVSACVLTALYVPESKAPRARRLDPVAQALLVVVLSSLTYGIIQGAANGYTSAGIVAVLAVAAGSLSLFVAYERRRSEPLVDMRFFRSFPFSAASMIAVVAFACLGGFLFLNTLYLQDVRHLSAFAAGVDTLPMALMVVVLPPVSGAIVARHGTRIPLVVSGAFLAASGLLLTSLTATTSFAELFFAYALFGIGFGMVNAPITNTAVSGMPNSQAGVAAAIASTGRQVGQVLGVAVLGALATATMSRAGSFGSATPALAGATHPGWWIVVGCGVIISALGWASSTTLARRSARTVAERFA